MPLTHSSLPNIGLQILTVVTTHNINPDMSFTLSLISSGIRLIHSTLRVGSEEYNKITLLNAELDRLSGGLQIEYSNLIEQLLNANSKHPSAFTNLTKYLATQNINIEVYDRLVRMFEAHADEQENLVREELRALEREHNMLMQWAMLDIVLQINSRETYEHLINNSALAQDILSYAHLMENTNAADLIQASIFSSLLINNEAEKTPVVIDDTLAQMLQDFYLQDSGGARIRLNEVGSFPELLPLIHIKNIESALFITLRSDEYIIMYIPSAAEKNNSLDLYITAQHVLILDGAGLLRVNLYARQLILGKDCRLTPSLTGSKIVANNLCIMRATAAECLADGRVAAAMVVLSNLNIHSGSVSLHGEDEPGKTIISLNSGVDFRINNLECVNKNDLIFNGRNSSVTIDQQLLADAGSVLHFSGVRLDLSNAQVQVSGPIAFKNCDVIFNKTKANFKDTVKFLKVGKKYANSLNLDASIIAFAKPLLLNCKIKSNQSQLSVAGELILDSNCVIDGSTLAIDATEINIGGKITLAKHMGLVAKEQIYFARSSSVQSETAVIDSDWVSIHGSLHVIKHSDIVAIICYVSPFANFSGSSKTINAFLYLNIGGLVRSHSLDVKSVFNVNCGLHMPAMPHSIKGMLNPERLGHFMLELLKETNRPLGTAFSLLSKAYAPAQMILSNVRSIVQNEQALSAFGSSTIEQIRILYNTTHLRHYLRMTMHVKQTYSSAMNLNEEVRLVKAGLRSEQPQQLFAKTNESSQPLAVSFMLAKTMLLPSECSYGVGSVSGASMSGRMQRSNFFDVSGYNVSFEKTVDTSWGAGYSDFTNSLSLTADSYHQLSGATRVNNLHMRVGDYTQHHGSSTHANNVDFYATGDVVTAGEHDVYNGKVIVDGSLKVQSAAQFVTHNVQVKTKSLHQEKYSLVLLALHSQLTATNLTVAGKTIVKDSMVKVAKDTITQPGGHLVGDNAHIETGGKTLIYGKESLYKSSATSDSAEVADKLEVVGSVFEAKNSLLINKGAELEAEDAVLKAQSFENNNLLKWKKQLDLLVKSTVNNGTFSGDRLNARAEDSFENNNIINVVVAQVSAPQVNNYNNIVAKERVTFFTDVFNNHSKIDAPTAQVYGMETPHNEAIANASVKPNSVRSFINQGQINAAKSLDLYAIDAVNHDSVTAGNVNLEVSGAFDNSGRMHAETMHASAKTFSNRGDISAAEQLSIFADTMQNYGKLFALQLKLVGDNTLENYGSINGNDLALEGNWVNIVNGKVEATASLNIKALFIYLRGSKVAAPNLAISSLAMLNVLSLISYHKFDDNILINVPVGGVIVPGQMPERFIDLFSPQNAFSLLMSTMQISGFLTATNAMRSMQKGYTILTQGRTIYQELRQMAAGGYTNSRLRNLIAPALAMQSVVETAVNIREPYVSAGVLSEVGRIIGPSRNSQSICELGVPINVAVNSNRSLRYSYTAGLDVGAFGSSTIRGQVLNNFGIRASFFQQNTLAVQNYNNFGLQADFSSTLQAPRVVNRGTLLAYNTDLNVNDYISSGTHGMYRSVLVGTTVALSGNVYSSDVRIVSEQLSLNKVDWRYFGRNSLSIGNYIDTADCEFRPTGDASFSLHALQAKLAATHHGENLEYSIDGFTTEQNNNLANGFEQFANITAKKTFRLKAKTSIELHNNQRNSLSVEAPSIRFAGGIDYDNLAIKATRDGIHIDRDANITDTFLLDSEQGITFDRANENVKIYNHKTRRTVTVSRKRNEELSINAKVVRAIAKGKIESHATVVNAEEECSAQGSSIEIKRDLKSTNAASSWKGRVLMFKATEGDITINGEAKGRDFAIFETPGELIEQTSLVQTRDGFKYLPSSIGGGLGLTEGDPYFIDKKYNGAGCVVIASRYKNHASTTSTLGHNLFYLQHGAEWHAAHHTYDANFSTRSGGFGSWNEDVSSTTTATQSAIMESKYGRNYVHVSEGGVSWDGVSFLAPRGTELISRDDIIGTPHIYSDTVRTETRRVYGFFKKNKVQTTQSNILSQVATHSDIVRLYSHTGKIHVTGTDFIAETPNSMLHLYAPKSVTINPTTLTHTLLEKKISVTPSVGLVDMARARMEDARKGNYLAAIFRTDLTDSAVGLAKSKHGLETVTGVWNVGVNGKNMYDLLQSGNLASYIAGQALKIGVTFSQTKTRTTQQTEGAGLIAGFGLVLVETLGDFNQGVHLSASKAIVHADRYNIYAFAAHNTYSNSSNSVTVSYGVNGWSAGAAMSRASSESTVHSNRITMLGELEAHVNSINGYGANTWIGKLSGEIGEINLIDALDHSSSKSFSVSGSTDGMASFSSWNSSRQGVGKSTSLHVTENAANIGKIHVIGGGKVTTGKHQTPMPGVTNEPMAEHSISRGFSASANFNAFRSKDGKPTPEAIMTSPFTVGVNKSEHRAILDQNGRRDTEKEAYNAQVFMPSVSSSRQVEAPADGRTFRPEQFGEAFDSFTRGLTPTWVADNSREEDMAVPRVKLWEYRAEEYSQDERPTLARAGDGDSISSSSVPKQSKLQPRSVYEGNRAAHEQLVKLEELRASRLAMQKEYQQLYNQKQEELVSRGVPTKWHKSMLAHEARNLNKVNQSLANVEHDIYDTMRTNGYKPNMAQQAWIGLGRFGQTLDEVANGMVYYGGEKLKLYPASTYEQYRAEMNQDEAYYRSTYVGQSTAANVAEEGASLVLNLAAFEVGLGAGLLGASNIANQVATSASYLGATRVVNSANDMNIALSSAYRASSAAYVPKQSPQRASVLVGEHVGKPTTPASEFWFDAYAQPKLPSNHESHLRNFGITTRNDLPLTDLQKLEIRKYAESLGMPKDRIYFYENQNTAYGRIFGEEQLNIGLDILPKECGLKLTANSRVSAKGAIAHELIGHRAAELTGNTQSIYVLEEAQASIRAARFAPDLSDTERYILLKDGIERLKNSGLTVREVKDKLWISQRMQNEFKFGQ